MTKPIAATPADVQALTSAPAEVSEWNNGRPFTIGATTYTTKFWNGVTYRNAKADGTSDKWIKLTPAQQKRAMTESYDAAQTAKTTDVVSQLKSVERGQLPSGSVVAKVTGKRSMATSGAAKKAVLAKAERKTAQYAVAELPSDAAELRRLIKSARSTRWASIKTNNKTRVDELTERLDVLRKALDTATQSSPAKVAPAKPTKAPAKGAGKATPTKATR